MTSPQALHMRSSTQERQSPEEHRGSHTKIMVGQCPVRGPVENVSIMGLYYFQKKSYNTLLCDKGYYLDLNFLISSSHYSELIIVSVTHFPSLHSVKYHKYIK